MDVLVEAALAKVKEQVGNVRDGISPQHRKEIITKAVYAVDALKSALKAL